MSTKNTEEVLIKGLQKAILSYDQTDEPDVLNVIDAEMAKKSVDLLSINNEFKRLLGKVLTQVDASIVDPIQRKALKDVLRNHIHESLDELFAYSDLKQ